MSVYLCFAIFSVFLCFGEIDCQSGSGSDDNYCGGNVGGNSGVIESPNFPSNYPDSSYCEWTVTVEDSSLVYLQLLSFDLENCCSCDYVEVRDGPSSSYPLLAQFCDPSNNGSHSNGSTVLRTSGNYAYVLFRSDGSITASGFQLYWEAQASVTTTQHQGNFTTTRPPGQAAYAFSVSLSQDVAIDNSPLVFDSVLYNSQTLYNTISGIFEPQVHGLYFLTTSCMSTAGTNFHVYITRNEGQILCKSFAAESDSFVGTCSAVAELFPGDQIRVTGSLDFVGIVVGNGFSGFTGYMITTLDD